VEHTPVFRLVVGLGNPGERYAGTRHNVGFLVVEELVRRNASTFAFESKWDSQVASCGGRMFMKPQTFMNLSGEAVANYARYYRIDPSEVLVILDDASLPLGDLRLRRSGSSGGHNGLESVLIHLGTEAVPRLRLGIGDRGKFPLDEFVLSKFSTEETAAVEVGVMAAADAAEFANAHGIEAAMNTFNKQNPKP
jgi:PTH1 family peptidyl-tRNA hydrolase